MLYRSAIAKALQHDLIPAFQIGHPLDTAVALLKHKAVSAKAAKQQIVAQAPSR